MRERRLRVGVRVRVKEGGNESEGEGGGQDKGLNRVSQGLRNCCRHCVIGMKYSFLKEEKCSKTKRKPP